MSILREHVLHETEWYRASKAYVSAFPKGKAETFYYIITLRRIAEARKGRYSYESAPRERVRKRTLGPIWQTLSRIKCASCALSQ